MVDNDTAINKKIIELLSEESGLFGHVDTLGQRPDPYEYIGYELSTDFLPTLEKMSEIQKKNLNTIMIYFQIHAQPLKAILQAVQLNKKGYDTMFFELAWSHFMTIVMFGMLEVAVKITSSATYNSRGHLQKHQSIKVFLEKNLPQATKDDVVKRYSVQTFFSTPKKFTKFSEIIDHLWSEIRSGFIHEAGIESKGLAWHRFDGGIGTEADPIKINSDVPMPEWLQITWQAILNSYGYKGSLELTRYKSA